MHLELGKIAASREEILWANILDFMIRKQEREGKDNGFN
jgi:hypothetical protein